MGEYADYEIERMMDEGYSPFTGRQPKGRKGRTPKDKFYNDRQRREKEMANRKPVDTVTAHEYPSSKTPPHLLEKHPEKKFDMSFFPVSKKKQEPEIKSPWDQTDDSPF